MRADSIRRLTRVALGLAALSAIPAPAAAQHAEPYRTRNLSPLVSIFGVPVWRTRGEDPSFTVTSELANHYRLSRRGDEVLILDGETWRNGLDVQLPFGERWFVGAEIAHYRVSGGVLDDVVDAWHSAFGMPDGGRDNRPEDALKFQLANADGVFYDLGDSAYGRGDTQLNIGRALGPDGRFVLTGTVKLATGDERMLAGSGSRDWAVTLMRRGETDVAGRPAGGYWGLGAVAAGEPERIEFAHNDVVPIAVVGGGWRVLPRFGVRAQLDLHGAFYETPLEELGQASAQATLGGWFDLGDGARIDFAVNEDLHVSTSPDVVLHAGLHWHWR